MKSALRPFCQNAENCASTRLSRHCRPCRQAHDAEAIAAKRALVVRSHCEQPDACKAKGNRHCHPCGIKKTFAEKPEVRAALVERSKNLHRDPDYCTYHKQIFNRRHCLPDEFRPVVHALSKKGYSVSEAAAIVRRDLVKGA